MSVHNGQKIVDSRDILRRVRELEQERGSFEIEVEHHSDEPDTLGPSWAEENEDDAQELAILTALVEEIDQNAGDSARDGVALIADSHFEEYAQELAEDIGAIAKDAPWPACHIDWTAAADALQQDYSSIEWDGETYWVRS
jgi:hypothetical protein